MSAAGGWRRDDDPILKQLIRSSQRLFVSPTARFYGALSSIKLGDGVRIDDGVKIVATGDLVIGPDTHIGAYSVINSEGGIHVGRAVQISAHCCIYSSSSVYDELREALPGVFSRRNEKGLVIIDDFAVIGAQCVVLPKTQIGKGAGIGAGSVVRGQVPSFEVWAGATARKMRDVRIIKGT